LPVAARTAIERTPLSDILSPWGKRRTEVGDEPHTTPGDSALKKGSEMLSGLGIRCAPGRLRQNPPRRTHAHPTGGFSRRVTDSIRVTACLYAVSEPSNLLPSRFAFLLCGGKRSPLLELNRNPLNKHQR